MSGLEREELASRINGATREEKITIAKNIDDDILWDELRSRFMRSETKVRAVEEVIKNIAL